MSTAFAILLMDLWASLQSVKACCQRNVPKCILMAVLENQIEYCILKYFSIKMLTFLLGLLLFLLDFVNIYIS